MNIKYLSALLVGTTIMMTSCLPQTTDKNTTETKTVSSTTSTSASTKTLTDKWTEYRGSVVEFNERFIKKYKSEQEAFQDILRSGNVIIDFYADWCGPCKRMAPYFSDAAKIVKNTLFVKINVDIYKNIAKKYGVVSLPTLVCFKNGSVAKKAVGFQDLFQITTLSRS